MFRVINLDPDPQLCRLASYLNLNAQIQSEGVINKTRLFTCEPLEN